MRYGRSFIAILLCLSSVAAFAKGHSADNTGEELTNLLLPFFKAVNSKLEVLQIQDTVATGTTAPGFLIVVRAYREYSPRMKLEWDDEWFGVFALDETRKRVLARSEIFRTERLYDFFLRIADLNGGVAWLTANGSHYKAYDISTVPWEESAASPMPVVIRAVTTVSIGSIDTGEAAIYLAGAVDGANGQGPGVIAILPKTAILRVETPVEILTELDGRPLERILAIEKVGRERVFIAAQHQYVERNGKWLTIEKKADYGVLTRTRVQTALVFSKGETLRVFGETSSEDKGGIHVEGAAKRFYPLPQPEYGLFAKYRPKRVADNYTEENTDFVNKVGPWQLLGNRMLFGLAFYDGEGYTGLGGYGYFDVDTGTYELHYLPQIADWSVSALLLDGNSLWLTLYNQPEGPPDSGGFARYDLRTKELSRYQSDGLLFSIDGCHGKLCLVGEYGLSVVDGGSVTTLSFVSTKDGRFRMLAKRHELVPLSE